MCERQFSCSPGLNFETATKHSKIGYKAKRKRMAGSHRVISRRTELPAGGHFSERALRASSRGVASVARPLADSPNWRHGCPVGFPQNQAPQKKIKGPPEKKKLTQKIKKKVTPQKEDSLLWSFCEVPPSNPQKECDKTGLFLGERAWGPSWSDEHLLAGPAAHFS